MKFTYLDTSSTYLLYLVFKYTTFYNILQVYGNISLQVVPGGIFYLPPDIGLREGHGEQGIQHRQTERGIVPPGPWHLCL